MNTWITIALALLSGGGIWSLISSWAGLRESRKERRKDYLEVQLQNLYSPLALLCHKVEKIWGFCQIHQDACHKYFESMDNVAREARPQLQQESAELVEHRNRYFHDIAIMRQEAQKLIEHHFRWLDSSDVAEAMNFILHDIRCRREQEEQNESPPSLTFRMPPELYKEIGIPSAWLPSFSKRIIERHKEKQREFEGLHKGWLCSFFKK